MASFLPPPGGRAALVKSFPPYIAAPFCMLVEGIIAEVHTGSRDVGRRKTFQESPRRPKTAANDPRASTRLLLRAFGGLL